MENLVCTGIQFNIFFDQFPNIRDYAQQMEKEFKEFFPDGFNIFPNPPAVPMEVAKFAGSSENGRYGLTVTGVSANFTQNITDDNSDLISLTENFRNIINKLYNNIITIHPDHRILFCGITMLLKGSVNGNATELIRDKFLKFSEEENLYDIATRFTFTKDEQYYINIAVNNFRNQKLESDGIQIQIDINDRYRLNLAQEKGSYSEENIQNILVELMIQTINTKIQKLFS